MVGNPEVIHFDGVSLFEKWVFRSVDGVTGEVEFAQAHGGTFPVTHISFSTRQPIPTPINE
jgi:hypothetical protein